MAKKRVSKKPLGPLRFNAYQTLSARIKWLRAKQKPYMTQKQLAHLSGVPLRTIAMLEVKDELAINLQLNTLRRLAHALGCNIFIQLKSRPSKCPEEFQLLSPALPPLPKRSGKTSEANHGRALLNGRSPYKNYRRRKRRVPHTEISGTPDLAALAAPEQAE